MAVVLRKTIEDDLPYVLAVESDDENRPFIGVWTEERHRAALSDEHIAHLIIGLDTPSSRLGFVILTVLNDANRSVELLRIVVTQKGRGYGRAAVRAVKQYAFEQLLAHRLWLDVKAHNTRARAVYEKEGFRCDGTLRECLKGAAGFESLVIMSILEQEYRASQQPL